MFMGGSLISHLKSKRYITLKYLDAARIAPQNKYSAAAGAYSPHFARAADSDIPKTFTAPTANQDYVKREVMIPMRDGVKLYTVIVVPKGARTRRFC